jgi:hypothetical protein
MYVRYSYAIFTKFPDICKEFAGDLVDKLLNSNRKSNICVSLPISGYG